jgi:hypothetical protein
VNVADLKEGLDATGAKVFFIYYFNPPDFAVYKTSQRVLIHFADDPTKLDAQRNTIGQIGAIRSEINGLVDGWRSASTKNADIRSKVERYDYRVADALEAALRGDVAGAGAGLSLVKQDILNERSGRSRFEYLLMAFFAVVGIIAFAEFAILLGGRAPCPSTTDQFLCVDHAIDLWRGFAGGAVGAFFSITLGIRGRIILPDLYRTANLMDAILRVTIGAIGGVVLVGLVLAQFVQFRLGSAQSAGGTPLEIFIISFVAGFSERLVPDLLAKADTVSGKTTAVPPAPRLAITPQASALPTTQGPATSAVGAANNQPSDDGDDNSSGADVLVASDEVTNDEDLPAASGGVASDQEET